MASEVGICNAALAKLGLRSILAFTDDRTEARLATQTYEDIRDDVLRDHPWNFATFRAELAAEVTAPAFAYARAFNLPDTPTYCLRVLEVVNPSSWPWKVEGRQILTDLGSPLQITFISRITNCDQMDALFRDALAARLAMEWAEKLTRTTTIQEAMAALYAKKLAEARSIDGQEGTREEISESSWISARW